MISEKTWQARFDHWWKHTETQQLDLPTRRIAGTSADVYTSVRDGDRHVAIKTVARDSADVMHDNCMLFSEFHMHEAIQRRYIGEKRPLRILPVYWIRKIALKDRVVVAFAMERLRETWYNRTCSEPIPAVWKREVLNELDHWNRAWGVFHRDPHLNNIGIRESGEWCLFDVSMSAFADGTSIYNRNAFYDASDVLAFHRDAAIFNFSWCSYQNDVASSIVKDAWSRTRPHLWPKRTPVLIKNCLLANKGRFVEREGSNVRVQIKLPNDALDYRGHVCSLYGVPTTFECVLRTAKTTSVIISVPGNKVRADVQHVHIAYYLFDI